MVLFNQLNSFSKTIFVILTLHVCSFLNKYNPDDFKTSCKQCLFALLAFIMS